MMRLRIIAAFLLLLTFAHTRARGQEAPPVLNLTEYRDEASIREHQDGISVVQIRGKVSLAAFGDYHAIVPGVSVRVAEYPESRDLNIKSGKNGWWAMTVIKPRGAAPEFSFVYEKKGWITTQSNAIPITDEDNLDLAIQYIEPQLFYGLAKPGIEKMLASMLPEGEDAAFRNAIVVTVGKSWCSIHDDRLPHGVAGATATEIPGAIGPIYFDETVRPNPSYKKSSVDGGVAWLNVPPGEYTLTAHRPDLEFSSVKFIIKDPDPDQETMLYIASPPDTILSNDDTNPE